MSNAIRDTLCVILGKIAPLAGLCHSKHEVTIEPPNWLLDYPHLRPADVGIQLSPSPSQSSTLSTNRIAIDVTVAQTPDFSHRPSDLLASSVIAPQAHKAHQDAARRKFASCGNNSLITHDINQAGIMLLPFTADLFGQVDHFFHTFLYPNETIIPIQTLRPGSTPPTSRTIPLTKLSSQLSNNPLLSLHTPTLHGTPAPRVATAIPTTVRLPVNGPLKQLL